MSAIVIKDLVVGSDKHPILSGLSLEVAQGKITGLVGPSGSGKTTLMRVIVGVQEANSGSAMVFEKPAGDKMLRSKIGYVTQSPAVYGDLTVEQNLQYFAVIAGADTVRVAELLHDVRLEDQSKQLVASLSGGQRARVSLAVALLGDPDLLILDEPTVGLDPILRNELWGQFRSLADRGKTLLVSSHVMDEAERCDDLILIRDGSLLWNNTRESLLNQTHTSSVGDAFVSMIAAEEK